MKKLILNQETLRNLTKDELQHVVGFGGTHTCESICFACPTTTVQPTGPCV
jgi:hypothetical protein